MYASLSVAKKGTMQMFINRRPYATTWMSLEDMLLSKISQFQKDIHCMNSPLCGI